MELVEKKNNIDNTIIGISTDNPEDFFGGLNKENILNKTGLLKVYFKNMAGEILDLDITEISEINEIIKNRFEGDLDGTITYHKPKAEGTNEKITKEVLKQWSQDLKTAKKFYDKMKKEETQQKISKWLESGSVQPQASIKEYLKELDYNEIEEIKLMLIAQSKFQQIIRLNQMQRKRR